MIEDASRTLKFVTSNKNKVSEMNKRLLPLNYRVEQANIGYPEVQADTLEEVVEHGLEVLRGRGEDAIIIEDSGLFVDALNGFPGVYSAYVQKTIGNDGMLTLLEGEENRGARFKAVIGLLSNGKTHLVTGACEGTIGYEIQGAGGFGYDPIFIPAGKEQTFAQISQEEKGAYSHRGKAAGLLAKLLEDMG